MKLAPRSNSPASPLLVRTATTIASMARGDESAGGPLDWLAHRPPGSCPGGLTRRRGRGQPGRDVGGESGQVCIGPRGERAVRAQVQLVLGQPAMDERVLERVDHVLTIGVGRPRRPRYAAGFWSPGPAVTGASSRANAGKSVALCPVVWILVPQLSWDSWDAAVILTSGFSGASGRGLTSSGSGKVTSTSRPPSGCGQATMLARCASAMACTMDRPRPRPSPRFVRSVPSRWNGWKSRPIAVAETVGPVLATERTARESLVAVVTATRPRATLWRSALSTRLAARRSARRGLPN